MRAENCVAQDTFFSCFLNSFSEKKEPREEKILFYARVVVYLQ